MQVRCGYCNVDVGLPETFGTVELSADEIRLDGRLLHICGDTRARAARARATAAATRDQARATVARSTELLRTLAT